MWLYWARFEPGGPWILLGWSVTQSGAILNSGLLLYYYQATFGHPPTETRGGYVSPSAFNWLLPAWARFGAP